MKRYCILCSTHRIGSTWLINLISSNSNIKNLNEFFSINFDLIPDTSDKVNKTIM